MTRNWERTSKFWRRLSTALPLLLCCLATNAFAQQSHRFGWKPDLDKISPPFELKRGVAAAVIKPVTNLTLMMPPIRDQGDLGSCTGHGVGRVLDYAHYLKARRFFNPSPLFIYYNERVMEGTIEEDAGAMIADGIASVNRLGAASERCWPYDISKFARRPKAACYKTALNKQALKYYKVDNGDGVSIRKALSMDLPVVFGCYVYNGIYSVTAQNPVLPMPSGRPVGGHCMVITGSNDAKQLYSVDNSWGTAWGLNGRFLIPYAYIHNRRVTDDCWVIELSE